MQVLFDDLAKISYIFNIKKRRKCRLNLIENMKINKILEKLGLSSKEALVYEAALELGAGSAQQIALKAGLPKSTVYDVLKNLSRKGLVNIYLKGKKKHFSAQDPEVLQDKIKQQAELLNKFLPDIQAVYNARAVKPKVRFYEGKQGVKIVIKEILKEARELWAIGSAEEIFFKLDDYFPEFSKQRAQKKIPLKVILRESAKAEERKRLGPQELRQVKIIKSPIEFKSLMWLWQNKLAMVTLGDDLMVVVIESKDIADTWRVMFEGMWGE